MKTSKTLYDIPFIERFFPPFERIAFAALAPLNAIYVTFHHGDWLTSHFGVSGFWVVIALFAISYLYALSEKCPICGQQAYHMRARILLPTCTCTGCNRSNFRRVTFQLGLEDERKLISKERFDRLNYYKYQVSPLLLEKRDPIFPQFTTAIRVALLIVFTFPILAIIAIVLA